MSRWMVVEPLHELLHALLEPRLGVVAEQATGLGDVRIGSDHVTRLHG